MSVKRILAVVTVLAGIILLAGAAALLTFQSHWFEEKVRERIITEVEKATGGRVEASSFEFDWKSLQAKVTEFTLHGKEPASEAPLFHAGTIRVGLKIISALRRDVDIASLDLEKPRINILVAADGSTNLPAPAVTRKNNRNPVEQVIALQIGRINLREGILRYDSQTLPLDVRGESLEARLDYDSLRKRYVGNVAANPIAIRTVGIRPFSVERVEAAVSVEGNAILVPRAHIALKQSTVDASGTVDDFKNLRAAFAVKAKGALAEVGPIVRSPLRHEGTGTFAGTVKVGGRQPVEIAGTVTGQGLGYTYQSWTLRDAQASARVHFTPDQLTLNGLTVRALNGSFRGSGSLQNLRRFQVKGQAEGFSLARLTQGRLAQPLAWSGTVSGPLELEGVIDRDHIGDAALAAKLTVTAAEGGIPLSGGVDVAYRRSEGLLKFGASWLQTPATRVNFEGTPTERLHVGLVSSNLNDALPALALLSAQPPDRMPVELRRAGEARFEGWVSGPVEHPHITGHASLASFSYNDTQVDALAADVDATETGIQAGRLTLTMGSLRLEGDGSLGLQDWKPGENPALSGKFSLRNADIKSLLGQSRTDLPVQGVVDANGTVTGTWNDLHGSARVQAANLYVGEQHFERGTADLSYSGHTLTVTSAQFAGGTGKVTVTGTWTHPEGQWKAGTVRANIAATGFPLTSIAALQQGGVGLGGAIDLKAAITAQVGSDGPRLTAVDGRLAVRDLQYEKTPLGRLTFDAVTQGGQVKLSAGGAVRTSRLTGEGVFELTGDYPGRGHLTLSRLDFADLEPFLNVKFPTGLPFRGFLEAGMTFDGSVLAPEGVRARIRVEKVEIRPKEREQLGPKIETPVDLVLRNAAPVVLAVDRKGISITNSEFVARNTDFFASGVLALQNRNPWDLKLKGKVDLAILDSFHPDVQAAGVSTLDATVRGSLAEPQINGRMELANASLYLRGLPNGIEKANGVVLFDRNRANLDNLTAQTGGGEISLGGFVGLGSNELIYRLQAKAARVRVRYPEGVSTTVDADLSLTGTSARSLMAGTITVVRSGFNPRTDLGSLLAEAGKPVPARTTPNEFLQGLQFDIKVDTAPNVQFQTSLARDLQMEAALRLRGSPTKPVMLGTVNVNRGEIQFFGTKYTINRGEIAFFNTAKIEPVLNMDVETRIRAVTVNINFSGPLDKLNVTYRSDPPLQSSEIIALLTVGRTPAASDPTVATDQQNRGNQNLFQSNANSLLGQAVTAPVSSRLERFFGVSRLKIDPQLTGMDNTPQARLTLEQQISKDVTLTYVTNITRSQQQLVRLEWNVSKQWSVVAVRDENGVFGIDFQYRRRIR